MQTVFTPINLAGLGKTCVFYFIRHGISRGNVEGYIQGRQDDPLTADGRREAELAGSRLTAEGIDLILSSPLCRARETADIIRTAFHELPPIFECPDLMELDTGVFTGKSFDRIRIDFPDLWSRFQRESWDAVPDAESKADLYSRATRHWHTLLEYAKSGYCKIVSLGHGGILQWLVKATFGHSEWMPLFTFDNCGLYKLMVHPAETGTTGGNTDWKAGSAYFAQWLIMNRPLGK